jgi:hypothetical protein
LAVAVEAWRDSASYRNAYYANFPSDAVVAGNLLETKRAARCGAALVV